MGFAFHFHPSSCCPVIAFHLDGAESDSSLSSRVVSGSGGGDLLAVPWVEAADAGVSPMDMDIDALRPSSLTSSQESGVGGPGDGGCEVSDVGVGLWISREADRTLLLGAVL